MDGAIKQVNYAHIVSNPDIAEGAPAIEGTRITVRCVAGYYQMGMTVDQIIATLRHLTPAQVHSALAYYFDHQDEINIDLKESSDEEYWEQRVLHHPAQKDIEE